MSPFRVAAVVAILAIAAVGYWWLSRPPGKYKVDNSGLYPISVDGKWGFMDRTGKTVIQPQFEQTYGFSEGLAKVTVGTKSGYINTKGSMVITPQFDDARSFQYGRASVKLCCGLFSQKSAKDRYGFIDKEGKYVSSPDFTWVGMFSGDLAPVQTTDGKLGFVDRSGKLVPSLMGKFEDLISGFSEGLAPAGLGGKWGYINTSGEWAINPQFEFADTFADGLAWVMVGGRTGYIDKQGKFVVNPQYDFGSRFSEGYAVVSTKGKRGFIDTKGGVVIEPQFMAAGGFSEGLASVKTEDGWGYINTTGKLVISPMFDSAFEFIHGLAGVRIADKEAYLTATGDYVGPFPGIDAQTLLFAKRLVGGWSERQQGARVRIIVAEWPNQFSVKAWMIDGHTFDSAESLNAYELANEPKLWELARVSGNQLLWRHGQLTLQPLQGNGESCPTSKPCSTILTSFTDPQRASLMRERGMNEHFARIENATLFKDMSAVFESRDKRTR